MHPLWDGLPAEFRLTGTGMQFAMCNSAALRRTCSRETLLWDAHTNEDRVFQLIDLRELASLEGPPLSFVSYYGTGPEGLKSLRAREEQLRGMLQDEPRALRLHHKPYSIVSYAWGQRYQQSNQWAIETLAQGAEPGIVTRTQAQGWLQRKGYQPTTIRLGPLTRLGARASSANVAFDDHPDAKRFRDRIETVTVDSVFAWLQRSGLSGPTLAVRL